MLKVELGYGFCSVCAEESELKLILTQDDPIGICPSCLKDLKIELFAPYSNEDWVNAKEQGLDLDNWNDYERYFKLGEEDDND